MRINNCQDEDLYPDISGPLSLFYNDDVDEENDSDDKDDKKTETDKLTQKEIEEKRSKFITRGLSKFDNIGNSCYMDSILQCLCYLEHLCGMFLDSESWEKMSDRVKKNIIDKLYEQKREIESKELIEACENTITFQFKNIMDKMWKYNYNISAESFKQLIGKLNSEFIGYGQKDSQELNSLILDRIHEETKVRNCKIIFLKISEGVKKLIELNRKVGALTGSEDAIPKVKEIAQNVYRNYCKKYSADKIFMNAYIYWRNYVKNGYSLVTKLFTGLYYSRIICDKCKTITSSFSPFSVFTIPTEEYGNTTLEECLKKFSEEELLTGKNKYNCKICGKVNAHKKMFIWEPPEILIIALKRFQNNGRFVRKTHAKVVFPIEGLELKDNYSDIRPIKNCVYDLRSIVKHIGSCHNGHYVSYCLNPINNLWYHFDDLKDGFWHIPKNEVEKEIITENAYILFYVKQ